MRHSICVNKLAIDAKRNKPRIDRLIRSGEEVGWQIQSTDDSGSVLSKKGIFSAPTYVAKNCGCY